jgi:hypothetical protein
MFSCFVAARASGILNFKIRKFGPTLNERLRRTGLKNPCQLTAMLLNITIRNRSKKILLDVLIKNFVINTLIGKFESFRNKVVRI